MFPEVVETERLRLEPRTPEYVDPFVAYEHCRQGAPHVDEVTEYLPWDPHPHPKETLEFLERGAEQREAGETADYVLRPREGEDGAGDVAGFGGIDMQWDRDTAVLGLWLRKEYWGRGYSAERALAMAELAFEHLDVEMLAVTHHVDNEKSAAAIQKYVDRMGGRREGVLRNQHPGDPPWDEVRYTVSQAEYRDSDADPEVAFYDADGEAWP